MSGIRCLLVFMIVGACGDDSGSARVDAATRDEDAPTVDIDAPVQAACDFTEAADSTNELKSMAEATNVTLGATKLTICGKVNTGHFNTTSELVDADGFTFTLASEADIIVHITGSGLGTPDDSVVQILSKDTNDLFGFGIVEGDNAAMVRHLSPGEWVIATATFNSAALTTAIDYRLTLALDAPATRCPPKTGTPSHTEATDNGMNDVATSAFSSSPQVRLTTSTTDAPEATNIEVAPGTSYSITGSFANVNPNDDYMDRDTFAFRTGATTTQMSVRLNWPSTTADLDFRIFSTITIDPPSIAAGLRGQDNEDEFETFAVKPDTNYWLWTAAYDGSTAPATYAATLCGETFTP